MAQHRQGRYSDRADSSVNVLNHMHPSEIDGANGDRANGDRANLSVHAATYAPQDNNGTDSLIHSLNRTSSSGTLATLVLYNAQDRRSIHTEVSSSNDANTSDAVSTFTAASEETCVGGVPIVFGRPLTTLRCEREMPVASPFLGQGPCLFLSNTEFQQYAYCADSCTVCPVLQVQANVKSLFRRNSPDMIVSRHHSRAKKSDLCRCFFRAITTQVLCYFLWFTLESGPVTILAINNNSNCPSVDFCYRGTRVRVLGVSGTSSTFSRDLRVAAYILKDDAVSLGDPFPSHLGHTCTASKDLCGSLLTNLLFQAIERHDRQLITRFIDPASSVLVLRPMAVISSRAATKVPGSKLSAQGTLQIFDALGDQVSDIALVVCTILMVLRVQESRKNHGTKVV